MKKQLKCPYRTREIVKAERGNFFEDSIKDTYFLPCYKEECGFWDIKNNQCSFCSRNQKGDK